jgi:hypothetical protein
MKLQELAATRPTRQIAKVFKVILTNEFRLMT